MYELALAKDFNAFQNRLILPSIPARFIPICLYGNCSFSVILNADEALRGKPSPYSAGWILRYSIVDFIAGFATYLGLHSANSPVETLGLLQGLKLANSLDCLIFMCNATCSYLLLL